ncbi:MAG: arylsulfatase [Saprospiraceae bacterium]|nr:arylsulfatase [Saprospiraceae bacterium]
MKCALSIPSIRPLLLMMLLCYGMSLMAQRSQPNIVIVITDDQGKNDLGCEGNDIIQTPHLDRFHGESLRLTDFHVSTTCTPSRASLMTGRHTNRLNAFHTIAGRSILFEDEITLPQVLAQAGYRTGMFGKWHLGDNYPFRPKDRGFHEVCRHGGGGVGQGPDYWGNDYFDDTYWKNGMPTPYEGYCTDVFFDEALSFIKNNQAGPFFCYISTNAPHGPLNVPEAYMDRYAQETDLNERQRRFYGMITNIDDNFGRLEAQLTALGIRDNTLVIFMTDNGTALGHQVYDAGMTGNKGSVYEGGHRVPCYLRWPDGNLQGGRDISQLTAHYDLLPTIVDLLSIPHRSLKPLDGISLLPLLRGAAPDWRDRILYMDTQRGINLVHKKDYTVMSQEWRLVNGSELYHMPSDLKQVKNVIDQHPAVVTRLTEGYEKWWSSILAEDADERYAYIGLGSAHENPVALMSHDILCAKPSGRWHQFGAIRAAEGTGPWKVEVLRPGSYRISIRRFPVESHLAINDTFAQAEEDRQIAGRSPASIKSDFSMATIAVGRYYEELPIEGNPQEVIFNCHLETGKYDMTATLVDSLGKAFPAYYVYVERIESGE